MEGRAPLFEEDLIGDYSQPRWTAHRRFGETRVYVIPPGTVEFEDWVRPTVGTDGEPSKFRSLYEVEFGLPGRFRLRAALWRVKGRPARADLCRVWVGNVTTT